MPEARIPDPTLMARLQLSVKGVDWAASLVKPYQHQAIEGEWTAHQQVFHLIATETLNFQPRIRWMVTEERPAFGSWDSEGYMRDHYDRGENIEALAERFMAERGATVELFKALGPEEWKRQGTWPDGRVVDLAWVAEKVLWHAPWTTLPVCWTCTGSSSPCRRHGGADPHPVPLPRSGRGRTPVWRLRAAARLRGMD